MKNFLRHLADTAFAWGRVFKLIWQTQPWIATALLLLTVLSGLVPSAQIQLTSSIVQAAALAIRAGHPQALVNIALWLGALQGAILLGSAILSAATEQVKTLFILRTSNAITLQVLEKSASLDVQYYENDAFYDKLQRANRESGSRPYQMFSQMIMLGSQSVTIVSVVAVLVSWNWWLGLFILLAPFPSMGSQLFYGQKGYHIERERTSERRRLAYFQYLMTRVDSVKEMRLFRLNNYFIDLCRHLYQQFYLVDRRLARQEMLALLPFTILTNVITAGAQIYAIGMTIALGQLGVLAGYIQAISVVQGTVQSWLWGITHLYRDQLFVNNLFEFFDTKPILKKSGSQRLPERLSKGIEFRGVSFAYPDTTKEVLHNLNIFLRAGECVALVGHNGAGKTTLVKLLTRLYEPSEGKILIDDIPLEEYDLDDLRRHISALFQDFVKYEMTVNENVGFGCVEDIQNAERIMQAAKASGSDTFIEDFSAQYKTTLGRMFADGQQLSIGQWQKIALARAFMGSAPVVILDEPTASLDAESEAEIFERMQRIASGATTLLVAHRFSTVRKADRILVLDHGKVVEDGPHEELLRYNGIYARLYNLQAAGYQENG